MNTMEITKLVGAFCGSLLVFLLISTVAGAIFDTSSDVVAFSVPVPEDEAAEGEDAAPAEAVDAVALVAAADPAAGEGVFRRCAACHKVDGTDGVGPHLNGVVGRDVAAIEGFNYSDALAAKEGAWTEAELYAFLENPKGYAPGTSMAFAGLGDSEDRANVIAYLAGVGG
jgi:cytochrome c